ncbi:universal stress protein [Pseudomonas sp. OTU5201]|uniref:universal stress protein n=1 Tax=Pseudomonas sp. OTU5201 TaxID=3043850 RepID=UPI00313F2A79
MTLQRLLLISDSASIATPAVARAAALAEATGAILDVVVCGGAAGSLWLLDEKVREQVRQGYLQRQRELLDELEQHLRARGIQVSLEAFWADEPEQEVLRILSSSSADLVIKATRHESGFKRAFITPLDWQLLRSCPTPLHLVTTADNPLPKKVAAAVDLSAKDVESDRLNERIVSVAEQFAKQCGARLHLIAAYDVSPSFLAYAASPVGWTEALQKTLTGHVHEAFSQFAERHGVPSHRQHLLAGAPARTIAEFAVRDGIDVVVMGTLTHSGIDKVLGSTSEQVLYKVPGLIAVRPESV